MIRVHVDGDLFVRKGKPSVLVSFGLTVTVASLYVCRALAEREVNILALQASPIGGKSVSRFIVDNPRTAKTVLDSARLTYVETEIVQIRIPHRPGEIARLASRLGEANININYAYCGLEPGTSAPLVFFGVAEVSKAVRILEQSADVAAHP